MLCKYIMALDKIHFDPQTLSHNNCGLLCHLLAILKPLLQTVWSQIRLVSREQSAQGPFYLPICKNRFEKFARIFSRRHKQTTFSDAGFLGILRVKQKIICISLFSMKIYVVGTY